MSDLCTLGSRPGMECVPLRSPADPYHYHHVTDQTKSLQELQNEVGALLEFRDLVIETFPDLKTKMASSAANSTLTGIPSSSLASSRREWEPGIRTRRKLTQKDPGGGGVGVGGGGPNLHGGSSSSSNPNGLASASSSSAEIHQHSVSVVSSLIRSRSNSHSGSKKEPKSGEANSGSVVIQDSGFSTETSSSKETHSASSSTGGGGGVQGTIVSNTTNRLTVDTEDELWNLLDVIHRKSNRLREEVDALQQLEREKCRTNQLNNNIHSNTVNINNNNSGSSSSSNNSNNIHTHSSSSSSSSGSNLPHHAKQQQQQQQPSANHLAKTFQNQLLVDIVNKDDVQILRKERDRLFEQLSDYEAEAMASRIRASKMQDEVDVLAAAKRELEDQLKAALSQKLELNSKIHDLHQQFVNKSAPSSPESIKSRHPLTPSLRKHSSSDSSTAVLHLSSSPSSSSAPTGPGVHLLKPRFSQSSFAPVKSVASAKAPAPVAPSAMLASPSTEAADYPLDTSPTVTSSTTSSDEPNTARLIPASGGSEPLGKLDGLLSSPARINKVRMTDSKKIAAILLETNIVELQRHLLTITVQNQVLQQRLEHATRSRIFLNKKLDKSKEDIDDLKFRLEEKNIELEGTKAQLRVLESKQQQFSGKQSSTSSGFSPEHALYHPASTASQAAAAATVNPQSVVKPLAVVSTSAGGIVTSHQHRSAATVSTSELVQLSPVHQHHHHQFHHHHQVVPQHQQRDLTLRLQQTSVSTPSMKAMIPMAMDEILHHSSSTESAQDQAERIQYSETPKRKPSKIPLPGTKGYVAPKPPTGRNFVAAAQPLRQDKSSPSPSGSLSNKSLNKSTGSLYMKSTGPSSITSANRKDTSMNRPESAQSWRRDTSLEKSRSSSIPVSKGSPVAKPSVVSSSPQPKAKRDSLTTRVKNLDSLSRLQTASTGNLSKSSSKKDLSSSFTTGHAVRPDRKQSASAIRRVSSASIGRSNSSEQNNNNNGSAGSASSATASAEGGTTSDNGKARRTNTFRLAKPTLMPPLEVISSLTTSIAGARSTSNARNLATKSKPPMTMGGPPRKPLALGVTPSFPAVVGCNQSSSSSSSGSAGSSPSSVTTITTIESHSSSITTTADNHSKQENFASPARDLIGEYLAAKSRTQPPAIFHSSVQVPQPPQDTEQLEFAYKHPILLMNDDDEANIYCSVVSSVGNERNREVEVKFVDDNSIELLDAKEDFGDGEKESLIVPRPKMTAFHSLKGGSPVKGGQDTGDGGKCRLVGKVNPNILKTWEQLSGGGDKNYCEHKRKNSKNSLITVTSSENSGGDKQSCLIFYRNQYNNMLADEDFTVNRIQHSSISTSSTTIADEAGTARVSSAMTTVTSSMLTSTTTTETTSSEGCYDFYDSIDDDDKHRGKERGEDEDEDDEYAMAAGEGLADFASIDRKKMMWSIDVE